MIELDKILKSFIDNKVGSQKISVDNKVGVFKFKNNILFPSQVVREGHLVNYEILINIKDTIDINTAWEDIRTLFGNFEAGDPTIINFNDKRYVVYLYRGNQLDFKEADAKNKSSMFGWNCKVQAKELRK